MPQMRVLFYCASEIMRLLLLSFAVAVARATLTPCSVTTGSVVVDLTPLTVKVGTG